MKNNGYDKCVQTPDVAPEEDANLIANVDALSKDGNKVLMSGEKISAIASGLVSNSSEINEYVQDNHEYYQDFINNPEHDLRVPTDPIRVFDL